MGIPQYTIIEISAFHKHDYLTQCLSTDFTRQTGMNNLTITEVSVTPFYKRIPFMLLIIPQFICIKRLLVITYKAVMRKIIFILKLDIITLILMLDMVHPVSASR